MIDVPQRITDLAAALAPARGYNSTRAPGISLFRADASISNLPRLQPAGILFLLQGAEHLTWDVNVYIVHRSRYLVTSAPMAFRIDAEASAARPLLAMHVTLEQPMAIEIAEEIDNFRGPGAPRRQASCHAMGQVDETLRELLHRILQALHSPLDSAILIPLLMRELHLRILEREDGDAIVAGLRCQGTRGKVLKTAQSILQNASASISVSTLAASAQLSLSSYHSHFHALFGCSPLQYLKAARLHAAHDMLRSAKLSIGEISAVVGYSGPWQFSREFRRYFGRTALRESKLIQNSSGDIVLG
ncbi:AraC family transcriptional regulator [Rhizobium sp. YTU87027]|uniref:AraC family transcriptional regulator n=1 Tax=Rhizobium sp. YTU87027 TaxID=3417741 RepID=UPI003D68D9DF